jgi:hypothetical protein
MCVGQLNTQPSQRTVFAVSTVPHPVCGRQKPNKPADTELLTGTQAAKYSPRVHARWRLQGRGCATGRTISHLSAHNCSSNQACSASLNGRTAVAGSYFIHSMC